MSQPLVAGLPQDLDLSQGCTIRFDAVDPASGATIANVKVSNASIWANSAGADTSGTLNSGPFMLVPGPGA